MAAHAVTRAALCAVAAHLAGSGELLAADGAIAVRVERLEAGGDALVAARVHARPALLGADRTVAVGVDGGQAGDPAVDELGAADPAVAVGVATGAPRLRLLGHSGACGQDGQNGGGADGQGGFLHLLVSEKNGRSSVRKTPVLEL